MIFVTFYGMNKWLLTSLLLLLLASCGKMEEPEFRRVEGFKIKKLGILESTIGFSTTYYNPNNFGVTVKEAVLDMYLDSVYVGKFFQPAPVSVTSRSEFSIPLEGKVSLKTFMGVDIKGLPGKEVYMQAKGSVRVGKAGVFITKDINYSGRHRIDSDILKNPAGAGSVQ